MKIRVTLRILLFVILVAVKYMGGMDWVIIVVSVTVVSDLDAIADALERKGKKECR
jgi:hypothetical protein